MRVGNPDSFQIAMHGLPLILTVLIVSPIKVKKF